MQHNIDALVNEFLGCLEEEEAKLLGWGIVDGGFTRDEVEELLTRGEITFDRAPSESNADTPHLVGGL